MLSTPLLSELPELASEWHATKNGELTPQKVTVGSSRKVWWRCRRNWRHEWQARVQSRVKGSGCLICLKLVIGPGGENSLAVVAPKLARQWHPTRNGKLRPRHVLAGSSKRVWWKCPKGPDHEWEAGLANRLRGKGCPFCRSLRISVKNSLATLSPDLASEWHSTKNGHLTPRDVTAGSSRKVWWRCRRNPRHEWLAQVNGRTQGRGCAVCVRRAIGPGGENSLAVEAPTLARQWHPTNNGRLRPRDVLVGSVRSAWWKCPKGRDHEWQASPSDRLVHGNGCPFCRGVLGSITNSLATLSPDLASEWHPTKNGELTPQEVSVGSSRKVWWRCRRNPRHEWQATVHGRTSGQGCAVCIRRAIGPGGENSLAVEAPKLARQWHPTKNGKLRPRDVLVGSVKRVWWKCPKGPDHEWQVTVQQRTGIGTGCPYCSNQRLSVTNSLAARYPRIAAMWHPTKNGKLSPEKIRPSSRSRVWWRCDFGHEWRAMPASRTQKKSRGRCPACTRMKRKKTVHTRRVREVVRFPSRST